jgi:hypothetical protein
LSSVHGSIHCEDTRAHYMHLHIHLLDRNILCSLIVDFITARRRQADRSATASLLLEGTSFIQALLLTILLSEDPCTLVSLLLGVGLACLDEALDSAGEASRRRLRGLLDSALLAELSVSLLLRRRRGGVEVCCCEAVSWSTFVLGAIDVDAARLRLLSSLSTDRSDSGIILVTAGLGVRVRCLPSCVVAFLFAMSSNKSIFTLLISTASFLTSTSLSNSSIFTLIISFFFIPSGDRLLTGTSLLLALYASSILSTSFRFASVLANLTISSTSRKVRT